MPSSIRFAPRGDERSSLCDWATFDLTLAAVAAASGSPRADIITANRGRARIAWARHLAMYLQHVAFGASLSSCARLFHRDRATVRHACARIEDARDEPRFDDGLSRLECALREQAQMLSTFIDSFDFNTEVSDHE